MTTDLVTNTHGQIARFTPDQIALIKRTICKGASDDELRLFMHQCERTGLDPLSRQIYAVKRWDGSQRREVMAMQVSIDGFRLIAERSGDYAGQVGPFWCGPDGQWHDVWLSSEPPAAARVGILRHHFTEPCWGVARFEAYAARTKEGKLNRMWAQMGDVMIAKCAEAVALRKAFPQELSGIYTGDEMHQADAPEKKSAYASRKDGDWEAIQAELKAQDTPENLRKWSLNNQERIYALPDSWQEHLREEYARRLEQLRSGNSSVKEQLRKSLDAEDAETVEKPKRKRGEPRKNATAYKDQAKQGPLDHDPETGEVLAQIDDPDRYLDDLELRAATCASLSDLAELQEEHKSIEGLLFPPDRDKADAIFEKHIERIGQG